MSKQERLEKAVVDAANAADAAWDAALAVADDAADAWVKAKLELKEYLKEQQGNE